VANVLPARTPLFSSRGYVIAVLGIF